MKSVQKAQSDGQSFQIRGQGINGSGDLSSTKPKVTGSNSVGRVHRKGWIPLNAAESSVFARPAPIAWNLPFALPSRIGQSLKRAHGGTATGSKVRRRITVSELAGGVPLAFLGPHGLRLLQGLHREQLRQEEEQVPQEQEGQQGRRLQEGPQGQVGPPGSGRLREDGNRAPD
jgi:hypothetical protein